MEYWKCLNFGPAIPYLGIFGLNSKKLLPYLKSAPANMFSCKISQKKQQKCRNLQLKMSYLNIFDQKSLFGWFWTGIWKKYCHIWDHHPWICLKAKFSIELKILKFCTKSAWIRYFWGGIRNQQLKIFSIAKFPGKVRSSKLGTKDNLISVF